MLLFNLEVPDEQLSNSARYITVDADGEVTAWLDRPERDDCCWYTDAVGLYLGHTDDMEEWDTHWYVKLRAGWHYEPAFIGETAPQGHKDDQTKLRYDLLPPHALEQLTAVLTYGAEKYGASATGNWRHVSFAEDRYYAAALRHIQAWRKGERSDPESGLPHLAHAMCSLTFLLEQSDDSTRS